MIGFRKQKFCDGCDMPIELCECETCENCEKKLFECYCEVCNDCDNFVEYCECNIEEVTDNTRVDTNKASICVDCGFHYTECECDTPVEKEEVNTKENKIQDGSQEPDEGNVEVVYVERPPSVLDRVWKFVINIGLMLTIAIVFGTGYMIYDSFFKEKPPEHLSVNDKLEQSSEILSLMYEVDNVEEIITNQEYIFELVEPSIFSNFDISKSDLYISRYGSFSNSPVQLEINSYSKTKDNNIVLEYTLTSKGNFPVNRLALMEFDLDKTLMKFTEYTTTKIK